MGKTTKKTIESFKDEVTRITNGEYTVISNEYINCRTKILIKHNTCGNEYLVTPNKFLYGRRCPLCSGKMQKTTEGFKHEVDMKTNHEFEVLSEYKNCFYRVKIRHKICGREFETTPNNFLDKLSCPLCGIERKIKNLKEVSKKHSKTTDIFKKEVKDLVGDDYTVIGEYVNSRTKIEMRHNKCGKTYKVIPNDFLQGYRCPRCRDSKGEKIIEKYLTDNQINFIQQKRFDECKDKRPLPFDFYLPDLNILIEYDGEQHFFPIYGDKKFELDNKHDKLKDEFSKLKNIQLIRIPYTKKDEIASILDNTVKKNKVYRLSLMNVGE